MLNIFLIRKKPANTSAASRTELSCGRSRCMVSVPPSRTVTSSSAKAELTTSSRSSSKVGLREKQVVDIVADRDQSRLKDPQILTRNNVMNNSVSGWICCGKVNIKEGRH